MNSQPQIRIEQITPSVALRMLEKNSANRPRSDNHVKKLARLMLDGQWKFNGDAIRFNGDKLIDGQHRLTAVIESGVTIESVVIENLEDGVFDTIDQGKKRSLGDTLAVLGEPDYTNLATAITLVDAYYTGKLASNALSYRAANVDAARLIREYPEARESIKLASKKRFKGMPRNVLAAAHCIISRVPDVDVQEADEFIVRVQTGLGLTSTDAEYHLRERLLQNAASPAKLPNRHLLGLCLKAWKLKMKGKPVKSFRLKLTGKGAEDFPTL